MYAKAAHAAVGQKRKYTGEDYIVHPVAVACIVGSVGHTPEMLAAALLHDTVEDTNATIEEIKSLFGERVSNLVGWLTDVSGPDDGNRTARKAMDRDHIARAPAAAQTIKLADLIDNTASIVTHDLKFAAVYLKEKAALLDVLKEGEPGLWRRANETLQAGLVSLGDRSTLASSGTCEMTWVQ